MKADEERLMRDFEARVKAEEERLAQLAREHEARMKAEQERQMRERIVWRQEHEQEVAFVRAEFRRQQEEFFRDQARMWQQERDQASASRPCRRRQRSL